MVFSVRMSLDSLKHFKHHGHCESVHPVRREDTISCFLNMTLAPSGCDNDGFVEFGTKSGSC